MTHYVCAVINATSSAKPSQTDTLYLKYEIYWKLQGKANTLEGGIRREKNIDSKTKHKRKKKSTFEEANLKVILPKADLFQKPNRGRNR